GPQRHAGPARDPHQALPRTVRAPATILISLPSLLHTSHEGCGNTHSLFVTPLDSSFIIRNKSGASRVFDAGRPAGDGPAGHEQEGTLMGFIVWLIIGGIVGWLASLIMRTDAQQGILMNIVVGIVGAFIAGLIFGGGNINQDPL